MTPKKTQLLKDKYPILFGDSLYWGFQCGDGWFDIIDNAAWVLTRHRPKLKCVQLKEKFGSLRIYVDKHDKTINGVLALAENMSLKTCEKTGAKGNLHISPEGWYVTMTDREGKKRGYKKASYR